MGKELTQLPKSQLIRHISMTRVVFVKSDLNLQKAFLHKTDIYKPVKSIPFR